MSRPVDIYRQASARKGIQGITRTYTSPPISPTRNGGITLYYHPISPPSRMVEMVAKHIGVPLQIQHIDLMKGEQKSEAYLAVSIRRELTLKTGQLVPQ